MGRHLGREPQQIDRSLLATTRVSKVAWFTIPFTLNRTNCRFQGYSGVGTTLFVHVRRRAFIFHGAKQSYYKGGNDNVLIASHWSGMLSQWLWELQHRPVIGLLNVFFWFPYCIRQPFAKRRIKLRKMELTFSVGKRCVCSMTRLRELGCELSTDSKLPLAPVRVLPIASRANVKRIHGTAALIRTRELLSRQSGQRLILGHVVASRLHTHASRNITPKAVYISFRSPLFAFGQRAILPLVSTTSRFTPVLTRTRAPSLTIRHVLDHNSLRTYAPVD